MANLPQRRYHRYRNYDYSTPGAYFLTICIQKRLPLLGKIDNAGMVTNDAGHMVETYWTGIPARYPGVETDAMIVMPDHLHGILFLGTDPGIVADVTLGEIVRWLKSWTTRKYAEQVHVGTWPPFAGRLWQANYYDQILRSDAAVDSRRAYIVANPWRWMEKRGLE